MNNILVVEDVAEKRAELVNLVKRAFGDEANVVEVGSVSKARRQLRQMSFDLLLMDVCLPNQDRDEPQVSYGFELIEEATWSSDYIAPAFTIVVSSLAAVSGHQRDEGKEGVFAWIYRDSISDGWKELVVAKAKYVHFLSTRVNEGAYGCDVAILCALEDDELDAVRSLPWAWREDAALSSQLASRVFSASVHVKSNSLQPKNFSVLCTAAPQMGMPAMAVLTSRVIASCRPRFVLMAGVAGAVRKHRDGPNFGDPLVAQMSWDFGGGKLSTNSSGVSELAPDLRPITMSELFRPIISKLKTNQIFLDDVKDAWDGDKPESTLTMHVGPVGSGAAVLASEALVLQVVKQHRKMIGFEMETYGMYYACVNQGPPRPKGFLSVKSVMDYGHEQKDDKYKPYAAYTSARVLQEIIESHLGTVDDSTL